MTGQSLGRIAKAIADNLGYPRNNAVEKVRPVHLCLIDGLSGELHNSRAFAREAAGGMRQVVQQKSFRQDPTLFKNCEACLLTMQATYYSDLTLLHNAKPLARGRFME